MQEVDVNDQVQSIEAVASEVISPPAPTMTLCSYGNKLTREELAQVRTPAGTATHKPIPHVAVVEKLIEALCFRQIGVVREEYAVNRPTGIKERTSLSYPSLIEIEQEGGSSLLGAYPGRFRSVGEPPLPYDSLYPTFRGPLQPGL